MRTWSNCYKHDLSVYEGPPNYKNCPACKAEARVAELEAENDQLKRRIAVENIPRDPLVVFEALREQARSVAPRHYEKVVDSLVRRISAERTLGDKAAEEIAELEAERDAHKITNEESMELYNEVVVGVAAMMDDPLKPCGDPSVCVGHFGEKTNKALRKAGKYLRDLQAERDRLAGALGALKVSVLEREARHRANTQDMKLSTARRNQAYAKRGEAEEIFRLIEATARAAGRGEGH